MFAHRKKKLETPGLYYYSIRSNDDVFQAPSGHT